MANTVSAKTSPHGVVRLILCNEIDLSEDWPLVQSQAVLKKLLTMRISEILAIIDSVSHEHLSTADIPQFGSIESLIRVPLVLVEVGCSQMNYAELGLRLKNDVNAKLEANIKFGENHGKGAALLGIVNCVNKRFMLSSLSSAFCQSDVTSQHDIILKLFFRIPIVQAILYAAKDGAVNGYSFMNDMTVSTKKRRGQCLRAIFREMKNFQDANLDRRLNNIVWDCL